MGTAVPTKEEGKGKTEGEKAKKWRFFWTCPHQNGFFWICPHQKKNPRYAPVHYCKLWCPTQTPIPTNHHSSSLLPHLNNRMDRLFHSSAVAKYRRPYIANTIPVDKRITTTLFVNDKIFIFMFKGNWCGEMGKQYVARFEKVISGPVSLILTALYLWGDIWT